MRTKTLLLTAALAAAGIATSMAQVYSVNAVGYVNTTLLPGYNLVSNPLNNTAPNGNTIGNLFAGVPDGTQVYKFNGTTFKTAQQDDLSGGFIPADAAAQTVVPGEGVFVRNPTTANVTVTFVGEVMQGTGATALSNPVPAGFSIRSSQVPQTGTSTALQYPAAEGDQIFIFNAATQKYETSNYSFGAWDKDPTINVGQAVFIRRDTAGTWTRSFTVNQ